MDTLSNRQKSVSGIKMDDLDHSIHIAEYDWTSFYEDSEECSLLQPSLAFPDNLGLSDSEDSEKSRSVVDAGQQEPQRRTPNANSATGCGTGAESCTGCIEAPAQLNQSGAVTTEAKETHLDGGDPAENVTGEPNGNVTNTLQSEITGVQAPVRTEGNTLDSQPVCEPDTNGNRLNVIAPLGAEEARRFPLRAEKERWFVTVNGGRAGPQPAASVKKKPRAKKKLHKGDQRRNPGQELPVRFESVLIGDGNESEGQRSRQNSGGRTSADLNPGSSQRGHESSSTSGEEENVSLPPKENTLELTDRNARGSCSLADTFPPEESRAGSDEFEDGVELFSDRSHDSESYLSAAESLEEPVHPIRDTQPHANSTEDRGMHGGDRASNDPALAFPKHQLAAGVHIPASGCSLGHRAGSPALPAPDSSGTRRPVADSPETYAEAAGNTQPVYAISAFWDEMEKLTINDILQLRVARSPPCRETQETVSPSADTPTHSDPLADTEEDYRLPDVGSVDISDTADSDYCTQPDECKRDCSSCDFSTSDLEDDYWQFISGNLSPDLCSRTRGSQRAGHSPISAHEEAQSTDSEGRETPVPLEDFDHECPRQLTKSKSMCNIGALYAEDASLRTNEESGLFLSSRASPEEDVLSNLRDSLGTPIAAPILSNTDVLDEHYRISFPEVFEYFFMQDKVKNDSRCVTVYDPEGFSVSPVFDYAPRSSEDELSISALRESWCSEGKRVPIFSCSHPTVRELTFPKSDYVFLSADALEEESISPIRVVSHCLIQPGDCGVVGSCSWKSLLSMRKICFHGKGSIWCRGSGVWVFPVDAEKRGGPQIPVLGERRVSSDLFQFRELAVRHGILDTMQAAKREGIFSALKQSDMCLVCIAFASWVLTSSDPRSADSWKAALLANVSALSAIQYLRHYVKKKKDYS